MPLHCGPSKRCSLQAFPAAIALVISFHEFLDILIFPPLNTVYLIASNMKIFIGK